MTARSVCRERAFTSAGELGEAITSDRARFAEYSSAA
jgi:hypothetical protein